jgi:hypothetical protein
MTELAVILVSTATIVTNLTLIIHSERQIRKYRRLSPPD